LERVVFGKDLGTISGFPDNEIAPPGDAKNDAFFAQ
jgi:hypothetical protein